MKNLLVVQADKKGSNARHHNNNDFQKDALLGYALNLPEDEHLDTAVLQLQAAGQSLEQHNNNNSSSSNSADYHQSLLQCVDLMPTITSNVYTEPESATAQPDNYRSPDVPLEQVALPSNCTHIAQQTDNVLLTVEQSSGLIVSVSDIHERYDFDGVKTASEVVNVANENCDSLAKLAYNLWKLAKDDHIVIDRKRNEVVRTNALTQQKTVYRCMDPETMGMRQCHSISKTQVLSKVGRPRKSETMTALVHEETSKKHLVEDQKVIDSTTQRTRYGRLVRSTLPQPVQSSKQQLQSLLSELKDKDYRSSSSSSVVNESTAKVADTEKSDNLQRPTRNVPPNAICRGCNKIFLGRRLMSHYVKFPDHMPSNNNTAQTQPQQPHDSLFGILTAKLQSCAHLNEEQRADLFLHELNDFVEQLQLRSTRLIRNTSGLHFVSARISRVLGIPEGQYALDMSAMESAQAPAPEPEPPLLHTNTVNGARNLVDYTGMSMSLDDTLTDEAAQRLNLSAGGKLLPPSEESLLRNVGDLMQPPVTAPSTVGSHVAGVNEAVVGALLPHYDHVSDNAVEALNMKETPNAAILDLNVDFFQFNKKLN